MATELTTIKAVKEWAGISDASEDALLQRLIVSASAYIETRCSRSFGQVTETVFVDGNGRRQIATPDYPVLSVQGVTIGGAAIPASVGPLSSGYYHDDVSILLRGHVFARGEGNIEIAYTHGFVTVPDDLAQACIEMVVSRYRDRGRSGLNSQSLHGEAVSFDPARLSAWARSVLAEYKRVWS